MDQELARVGHQDPESSTCMSQYASRISQVFKDHIWTQLSLGHIAKQIYDKHKTIWRECFNAREVIMKDDFIRLKDIAYLDH